MINLLDVSKSYVTWFADCHDCVSTSKLVTYELLLTPVVFERQFIHSHTPLPHPQQFTLPPS